jgi:hypothetical protein
MNKCCNCNQAICECGGFTHPTVIFNPPGQKTLAYRVGDYLAFRRALLQSLAGETELSGSEGGVATPIWQPSGHGDLALQMMEWWAYLADILTFYNQRIANQAYLQTADLPESVKRLIRLLGYRPRPGIAATGTLAALSNTPLPFTLPRGFGIQSKPGPGQQPQIFEVSVDTIIGAQPTSPVSRDQVLGAAPATAQSLSAVTQFTITTDSSTPPRSTLTLSGKSTAVKGGDRVLVLSADSSSYFGLGTVTSSAPDTDPALGAITSISVAWDSSPNATTAVAWQLYRAGQSTQVWQYKADAGLVVGSNFIVLQSIVRGLTAMAPIVFQYPPTAQYQLLTVQSTTEAVWYANPPDTSNPAGPPDPSKVPPIPIPHTVLNVNETIAAAVSGTTNDTTTNRPYDLVWHSWSKVADLISLPSSSTVGGAAGSSAGSTGSPASTPVTLDVAIPVSITAPVLVEDSVGTGAMGTASPGAAGASSTITVDTPVPRLIPPLQVYFNLLPVTRGKSVTREILGSGDGTLAGQDFTLQQSPVTYLQDPASKSGTDYSSTVRVWVNELEWTEVQSFYGQDTTAQVFVTQEDVSGKTHISFGDGIYGARLPTGVNNVVATYRYGSGALSPDAGTLTVVLKPQPGLRSIVNPVAVGGGSDPDAPTKIRQLAPQSVLTFARAVSADDFRVIAALAPGVTRAGAAFAFDPAEQRPRVTVWVGDTPQALANAIRAISAAADPNRMPSIIAATKIPITLSLSIAVQPKYQAATVKAAVYEALLDPDSGLLGVNVVGIGQVFFDSQIYATCLAVAGVEAVHGLTFAPVPKLAGLPVFENPCSDTRHDPGTGSYYFLADDGVSLTISVEAES